MDRSPLLLRRYTKAQIIEDPPKPGELVFSTDTRELGWTHPQFGLLWRKIGIGKAVTQDPWLYDEPTHTGEGVWHSEYFGELRDGTQCLKPPGEYTTTLVSETYETVDYTEIESLVSGLKSRIFTKDYPSEIDHGNTSGNPSFWDMIYSLDISDIDRTSVEYANYSNQLSSLVGGNPQKIIAFLPRSETTSGSVGNDLTMSDGIDSVTIPLLESAFVNSSGNYGYVYGTDFQDGTTGINTHIVSEETINTALKILERQFQLDMSSTQSRGKGEVFTFLRGKWYRNSRIIQNENEIDRYFEGSVFYGEEI